MKKTYETPCADKIAFNYRDQVVAASGDPLSDNPDTGRTYISGGCDVENMIAFGIGFCRWA